MPSDSKFCNEVTESRATSNEPLDLLSPRRTLEVEFIKDARSGVETWNFDQDNDNQGKKFSLDWTSGLINILRNNLVSWQPSFPLQYPWSRECSKKTALETYFHEGRDRFVTFKFSHEADVLAIAKELKALPEIDRAVAVPLLAPPSQPLEEPFAGSSDQVVPVCGPAGCLTNQWYLFRCGVPDAWAEPASGNGVVIADIDWGFDLSHPDLINTELTKNVIRDSPNVSDGNLLWHGNGVLGLAGAAVNAEGMAGIAYEATLWAIQAATGAINRPVVDPEFWVAAIHFVRVTPATGRKIIIVELQSAKFSNPEMLPTISHEIKLAIDDQIVVCVPAGNGNRYEDAGRDDQGVAIPETGSIVVGATVFHPEKNLRAGSNGGSRVTVYAPGDSECDLTCGLRKGYRHHFGGTSGATAKVAGIVALMLEKNDLLTPDQIRYILAQSQKPVVDEDNNNVGVLVDATQAVSAAMKMPGATLPAAKIEYGEGALQAA
jgi:hypothetical protein